MQIRINIRKLQERERERTIFIGNLDVQKEKLEARSVRANDLLHAPLERSSAANRRVRVTFYRRLVHRHYYPSRLAFHFHLLSVTNSTQLRHSLFSFSACAAVLAFLIVQEGSIGAYNRIVFGIVLYFYLQAYDSDYLCWRLTCAERGYDRTSE